MEDNGANEKQTVAKLPNRYRSLVPAERHTSSQLLLLLLLLLLLQRHTLSRHDVLGQNKKAIHLSAAAAALQWQAVDEAFLLPPTTPTPHTLLSHFGYRHRRGDSDRFAWKKPFRFVRGGRRGGDEMQRGVHSIRISSSSSSNSSSSSSSNSIKRHSSLVAASPSSRFTHMGVEQIKAVQALAPVDAALDAAE
ncbi:hypothetical protein EYF80_002859 [Liparis tanakae]|uniref:Uncharacterized protein n=1 Tax=Liparis tanakae TaxID=230148 RepID=A0A4Z2JB87_9TELE|nr:hypothetical protein EYF80_002859 [Liparis tanakae]